MKTPRETTAPDRRRRYRPSRGGGATRSVRCPPLDLKPVGIARGRADAVIVGRVLYEGHFTYTQQQRAVVAATLAVVAAVVAAG